MGYVTPEQISKAKEVDLLTWLQNHDEHELVHVRGSTYCTREHDSLKISNGKWHWFSRGIGGKTALDYLIKVQGYSFTQAVETILGQAISRSPPGSQQRKPEAKKLLLPKASRCATHAVSYLHGRGISYEVIDFCIQTGRLYESLPYRNCVFVGRDLDGKIRYAALRSITGDYKGDATGSDKRYSFSIAENRNAQSVHVFESAIDLLSYATLLEMKGQVWRQRALLSLAGVFQTKRKDMVPLALSRFLQDYPGVKMLHLHLDNDEVGRGAVAGIAAGLGEKYTVLDQPPPSGKDVNELLQRKLGIYRQKERGADERIP